MAKLLKVTESQIKQFKSFREFDEHITAPLHGFAGSRRLLPKVQFARTFLKGIATPTLVVHAKDDPFMHEQYRA